jgi:hypothetical protein
MKPKVVFKGTAFPESLRWHKGDVWFSDVLSGVVYRGDVTTGQLHKEAEISPLVPGGRTLVHPHIFLASTQSNRFPYRYYGLSINVI